MLNWQENIQSIKKIFLEVFQMKKILSAVIIFCVMIFSANCQARQIPVADESVKSFYGRVIASAKKIPLLNLSVAEHSKGLTRWYCDFRSLSNSSYVGTINFYENDEGYLHSVEILSYNDHQDNFHTAKALAFVGIFHFLVNTRSEVEIVYNQFLSQISAGNYQPVCSVWSYAKNRNYVIKFSPAGEEDLKISITASD